jgi:membrane fusion protein (multidrug efflux system)
LLLKRPVRPLEEPFMARAQEAPSPSFYLLGGLMVVAAGLVVGYFHFAKHEEIATVREARAMVADLGPRIEVVTSQAGPTERVITLLADVRAVATTTMYAKLSGYLKSVTVDKGDRVEAGQVVAEIESLELGQQYASATADLQSKRRNAARARDLFSKGTTTEVAKLQAETDATMAENNVAALATNMAYQIMRAPFAGHVTARFVDPGALITNAQTNFVSATPVLTISDDSRLRVYTYVQQQDVPFVHVGDRAEVVDASNPDRSRAASVTRMTGELDAKSHTMLVEVDIDNSDQFLTAGSFAYVSLHVPIKSYPQIPVTALMVRGNDSLVAVLEGEVLRFRAVKVASTDGAVISLNDGLQPGERIAINVPDEIIDGNRIQVVKR